jgi:hypothetical protein
MRLRLINEELRVANISKSKRPLSQAAEVSKKARFIKKKIQ